MQLSKRHCLFKTALQLEKNPHTATGSECADRSGEQREGGDILSELQDKAYFLANS